jgi:FG-GAP repeat protein
VWAFARSGSRWVRLGPKLVGRGGIGPAQFGAAVALAADGRTLLVGAPADGAGAGAAWIFRRRGPSWQRSPKLTGRAGDGFGASVALSDSGRVAVIGGTGGAWVYVRRGRSWRRASRLAPPAATAATQFGKAVAVSGDGSVALVGAPGDGGGAGAAWLFARRGAGWAPVGGRLTGAGADGVAGFGRSVALSGDGATALVGGPIDGNGAGAAWRFRVGRSSWSPDGKKLTATGETGPGQFGDSVALSADGDAALVGGALDTDGTGAAWSLARDGPSQRLRPAAARRSTEFGNSVALSGAGTLALVGSVGAGDFVGAAWTFRR